MTAPTAGAVWVSRFLAQSRAAASRTDAALQELFAIGLHLERVRKLDERAGAEIERVIDSLAGTIELLRSTIKMLIAEAESAAAAVADPDMEAVPDRTKVPADRGETALPADRPGGEARKDPEEEP